MIFPKPSQTLWQLLGPSIIFVALSLNGGEMLLWPNLVARYGFTILAVIPLILVLQAVVNLEIARITVLTGKNTLTSLTESINWLSPFFFVSIVVSLWWPAWISTAGNMIAYLVGAPEFGVPIAIALLLSLGALWLLPKTYSILEVVTRLGLVAVLAIAVYVIFNISDQQIVREYSLLPAWDDSFLYVSGLAFGGVAGVLNLVQSNWVAQKDYGNSQGQKIEWEHLESKQNWQSWWRLIRLEHLLLFVCGNAIGIGLIGWVAEKTLQRSLNGFEILTYQVDLLGNAGILWGIGIVLLFIMAQATILDAAGRLLTQLTNKKTNSFWSLLVLGFGAVILLITGIVPGFNQPAFLLQLSAILSAAIFTIYPPFILGMTKDLPKEYRPALITQILVWLNSLLYGGATIWVLLDIVFS